jgi:hypothetical protein
MDNSVENSGLALGIRNPTRDEIHATLGHQTQKNVINMVRHSRDNLVNQVKDSYVFYEMHIRPGHILEDVSHFFNGTNMHYEDQLAYIEKLRTLPSPISYAQYALMSIYKGLRKQQLILQKYSVNNRNEFDEYRISELQWLQTAERYAKKAARWGKVACDFSTMLHAIVPDTHSENTSYYQLLRPSDNVIFTNMIFDFCHIHIPKGFNERCIFDRGA